MERENYENNETTQFSKSYSESHVTTKKNRSILPDLSGFDIPADIKNRADAIFNKMTYRVHRGNMRKKLLFYCVYNAYIESDITIDPISLGHMFELKPGEVQKCDSIFSPLQTGYYPKPKITSPIEYIPSYCKKMGLTSQAEVEIISIAQDIMKKDPDLRQQNPQTVAAGFLKYYIVTNGITVPDSSLFRTVTGRSNVTIESMYRKISTIDNS